MAFVIALIVAAVAFIISITIILIVVGPTILLQPRKRTAEFYSKLGLPTSPADVGLSAEDIVITTNDGTKLSAWFIKSPPGAKGTIFYLHGVGDCKIDGIRFAKLMHDNHFHVLLYDSRQHGKSDGKYCTYGYYERNDVPTIINYVVSRPDLDPGKFGLFGTSMGAAVAIQAAAIDKRIAAVCAENSFLTLRKIFDDYQKRMIKLPFHYLRNLVIIHSELRAKFRASDVSPLEAVKNISIPLLIIYGTGDHLIRHEYSIQLYEAANEPKALLPVPGAAHNNTWDIAGKEYERQLLWFFTKALT